MNNFKFIGKTGLYTVSATAGTTTLAKFKDYRGINCSITVADTVDNTILLGHEQADIKRLIVGEGMRPVHIPEPYIINTQMSLNSSMAADLIEVLKAFIDACDEKSLFDDEDETTLILPSPTTSEPTILDIHEAPTELPPSCSAEISECITGLSELYNHCYQSVGSQRNKPLDSQEVRDAARSLFAQTVRNFNP